MTLLVIFIFIFINLAIIASIYFAFLRNLSATQGYFSLAVLIAVLAITDVFLFDYANQKIKLGNAEEIIPEQCTKLYVEQQMNQLSKIDDSLDKKKIAATLLQCFADTKQVILIKHSVETSHTVISGKPSKMALDQYLQSLIRLNLGDSIHVDLVENNSAGLIMYLEISEKQANKPTNQ